MEISLVSIESLFEAVHNLHRSDIIKWFPCSECIVFESSELPAPSVIIMNSDQEVTKDRSS